MYLAHTPQVFKKDIIYNALRKSIGDKVLVTDEASACEYMGIPVDIVLSNYENVKVTYAEDIDLIKSFGCSTTSNFGAGSESPILYA